MSKAFTDEESADSSIGGRTVLRAARGAERPMTLEGYRALLEELRQLVEVRRPALKQRATSAVELDGQLSELDHRAALINATLESVRVVPASAATGRVQFGSTVTLKWADGRIVRLRLVGPDEVDVKNGSVSIDSPLARSLVEREAGDEVEVERPRGTEVARLLAVE